MQNKIDYVIGPRILDPNNFAGSKFPNDIMRICCSHGIKKISVTEIYTKKTFWKIISDLIKLLKIPANSEVIYIDQVSPRISRHLVYFVARKKKISVIPLLEDIDVLRNVTSNKTNEYELGMLKRCELIISQNSTMTSFLREHDINASIYELSILDYLAATDNACNKRDKFCICYGGNLTEHQSGFIYLLDQLPGLKFSIYGKNQPREITTVNTFYKGTILPEKCAEMLEGGWGLVWNGKHLSPQSNDVKSIYYNIVSPHKFSMYLVAGMPVIVYKESAMADFVISYKCGITIGSLTELPQRLTEITADTYAEYCDNARNIGKKLSEGYYFNKVLRDIEEGCA